MRWEKRGMIFDCNVYGLEYAKSPQAVVFDDFIRIYFSTCQRDGTKLISHVAFVDFDRKLQKVLKVSRHEVLERGKIGCFDEHGIFPFSPVIVGNMIYGYTSGWSRRVSVSVDTGIGLAVSEDGGSTFHRIGDGPVLTSSLFEPFLVIDGFVLIEEDIFHMWYIYGTEWKVFKEGKEPERLYKIAHATSEDGVNWIKEDRPIITNRLEQEAQALPTVIKDQDLYHMYFCYREADDFRNNPSRSYRIGYAYSNDLVRWTREDEKAGITVSDSDWDNEMQCYPNVFKVDDELYMLYNGNCFGKYGFGLAKLIRED